jgi:hypothetical protein
MLNLKKILVLLPPALILVAGICSCNSTVTITPAGTGTGASELKNETNLSRIPPATPNQADPVLFKDWNGRIIDYSNPELFLKPGNQSMINNQNASIIQNQIYSVSHDMAGISAVYSWKDHTFKNYAAGGIYVGKRTVDKLIESRQLSGCHDHGLLLSSVLRKYGFPSIMVDATGIQWAYDYAKTKSGGFSGHIFVETYLNGRWILINSTSGEYIYEYNPANPVIPMKSPVENRGYYTLFKGFDPEDYGITDIDKLNGYMKSFAEKITDDSLVMPNYKIDRLILK